MDCCCNRFRSLIYCYSPFCHVNSGNNQITRLNNNHIGFRRFFGNMNCSGKIYFIETFICCDSVIIGFVSALPFSKELSNPNFLPFSIFYSFSKSLMPQVYPFWGYIAKIYTKHSEKGAYYSASS